MTDRKTPRVVILFVILASAAAIVVGGCGGSGGTTATEQGPPPGENTPEVTEEAEEEPAEETPEPAEEEEPAEVEEPAEEKGGEPENGASAAMTEGKMIFTTNCGSCHTLAAAGTSGEVGPDLDELKPSEPRVEQQVINGGGPMPAFGKEGILSPEEVKAVSTYVASVAGTE